MSVSEALERAKTALAAARLGDCSQGEIITPETEEDIRATLQSQLQLRQAIDECEPYLKEGETPLKRMERYHAEVLGLMAELERVSRNRDMWRGQCHRQADKLRRVQAAMLAPDDSGTD